MEKQTPTSTVPVHLEDAVLDSNEKHPVGSCPEDVDADSEFSHKEQRSIIHKVDRRLLLVLGLIYCVSLIDRSNLANAAVAGMNADLDMVDGYRYSIINLIFFATYIVFQPPATVITRKIGPRVFLSSLALIWGALMIGMGHVKSWVDLIPLRLLLGVAEAGYFPGCVYLISTYYSRFDLQKRYAVFYIMGTLSSAFAGLLAWGIQQMQGINGYAGWRWIFIIEGCLTFALALLGFALIIDFPDQIVNKPPRWFLKSNEIQFLIRRINRDRNDAEILPFTWARWLEGGKDWKIWSFGFIYIGLATLGYSIVFFLPIILRDNMGYSSTEAQYLSAPPYVFACIVMWGMAWAGDKYHVRGPLLLGNCLMGLIGCPLLGWAPQAGVRYFGVFLLCGAGQGAIPTIIAYQANNIRGHWKRAFCSASLIGTGAIGGIAGSLIFRTQDRPHYLPGIYGCMAANVLVIVVVSFNCWKFRELNRRADRGEIVLEGDPTFRYTI